MTQAVPLSAAGIQFAQQAKFGPVSYTALPFAHEVAIGTPLDRILEPDYWRLVVSRPDFRPGCLVQCICESPGYFAELLVREVNAFAGYATVVLLRHLELQEAHPVEKGDGLPTNHSVRYLGPLSKWGFLRDKQTLKDGFDSRADALRYAREVSRLGQK